MSYSKENLLERPSAGVTRRSRLSMKPLLFEGVYMDMDKTAEYHSGTKMDAAVCSNCGEREVFEEQKILRLHVGNNHPEESWLCVLRDAEEVDTEVTCPDCEPTVTGTVYFLE